VSRFDNFGISITISTSYSSNGIYIGYANFISDVDNMEYHHTILKEVGSVGITIHACGSPFESGISIRVSDGERFSYTVTSNNSLSNYDIYNSTRSVYFLKPYANVLYNTSGYWLGHVKWGGKYDIY
jgi:hypothetical protein